MPKIRTISFDPKLHRYNDEDKLPYLSVTTQVDKYKEPFDKEYWSKKKAQELGLTQGQVLANWDKITKDSHIKGNKIHERLEDSVNDSRLINTDYLYNVPDINYNDPRNLIGFEVTLEVLKETPLAKHYPKIFELLEFYINKGYRVYAEKRIYLFEYQVAGTIDLVLIKDKEFIIVDWKTNKDDLKFVSGYFKKVNGIKTDQWVDKKSYYLYPLDKVEECKGNGYSLQLSSYAWMLEQWGFKCIGLILCHIRETKEDVDIVKEKKVEFYKIRYMKAEVKSMFEHSFKYRNNSRSQGEMKFASKFSW